MVFWGKDHAKAIIILSVLLHLLAYSRGTCEVSLEISMTMHPNLYFTTFPDDVEIECIGEELTLCYEIVVGEEGVWGYGMSPQHVDADAGKILVFRYGPSADVYKVDQQTFETCTDICENGELIGDNTAGSGHGVLFNITDDMEGETLYFTTSYSHDTYGRNMSVTCDHLYDGCREGVKISVNISQIPVPPIPTITECGTNHCDISIDEIPAGLSNCVLRYWSPQDGQEPALVDTALPLQSDRIELEDDNEIFCFVVNCDQKISDPNCRTLTSPESPIEVTMTVESTPAQVDLSELEFSTAFSSELGVFLAISNPRFDLDKLLINKEGEQTSVDFSILSNSSFFWEMTALQAYEKLERKFEQSDINSQGLVTHKIVGLECHTCPDIEYCLGEDKPIPVGFFIIVLLPLAVVIIVSMILLRMYSEDDAATTAFILGPALVLYDLITDVLFIKQLESIEQYDLWAASISFLVIPMVINTIAVASIFYNEFRSESYRKYHYAHLGFTSVVAILSSADVTMLQMLHSYVLKGGWSRAPIQESTKKYIQKWTIISLLLKDVPQLIIQQITAARGCSEIEIMTIFATFGTILSIIYGVVKALSLCCMERRQHERGSTLELVGDSVSESSGPR